MLDQIRELSRVINLRSTRYSDKRDAQRAVYGLLKEAGMSDEDHSFKLSTGEKIGFNGIFTLGSYKSYARDNKSGRNTELFVNHVEKMYI